MIQHPMLRVIMAVYLAIWSPIACCCAVKSALGTVTGVEVGCCASVEAKIDGAKPQAADEGVRSCCRPAEKPTCEQSDAPAGPADNCKCKGKVVKIAPSESAVKISVPMFFYELPAVLTAAVSILPAAAVTARSECVMRGAHGPPRASLFAQHCLLTT